MADNPVLGGIPVRSKDIGGNQHFMQLLADHAGVDVMGLVTANPGANTVLGRLKAIVEGVEGLRTPHYETVAAGAVGQVLGGIGAAGDLLAHLTIFPASLSPGPVSIKDGAGGAIVLFPGGANSVSTLHPFTVTVGANSALGGWIVVTGANVSALAVGRFT